MYALRMSEWIGRVDSRMLTISRNEEKKSERQEASEAPPQIVSSWPVIAAAAVKEVRDELRDSRGSIRRPKGGDRGALATRAGSSIWGSNCHRCDDVDRDALATTSLAQLRAKRHECGLVAAYMRRPGMPCATRLPSKRHGRDRARPRRDEHIGEPRRRLDVDTPASCRLRHDRGHRLRPTRITPAAWRAHRYALGRARHRSSVRHR